MSTITFNIIVAVFVRKLKNNNFNLQLKVASAKQLAIQSSLP
jgi:hypothetical protein